jgi:hypothetical protein
MNGLDTAKVYKSFFDFNTYLSGFGQSRKLINNTVVHPAAPDLARLIFTALIFNCPYLQVGDKLNAHHRLGFSPMTCHIWLKPNKKGSSKQRHKCRCNSNSQLPNYSEFLGQKASTTSQTMPHS